VNSHHRPSFVPSTDTISFRILAHHPEPLLLFMKTGHCRGTQTRSDFFGPGECRLLGTNGVTSKCVYGGIIIATIRHKIWISSDSLVCPGRTFRVP